ncbi:MAG: nucleotidyltransferase substrate binding protein [Gammaproteobacteria bacterium]|nr:nucleotidyltransferase substrate binding protein [Gammaproteobacteria bacterium]
MAALNTEHLQRCIETLEQSLALLQTQEPHSLSYEIFRNATIKGYELTLETAGTLLKKALKPYFSSPKEVDQLTFKDLFRHGAKHNLLSPEETTRWFKYRDNRNNTAHDYGVGFAETTLTLLPDFIIDAKQLKEKIDRAHT